MLNVAIRDVYARAAIAAERATELDPTPDGPARIARAAYLDVGLCVDRYDAAMSYARAGGNDEAGARRWREAALVWLARALESEAASLVALNACELHAASGQWGAQ